MQTRAEDFPPPSEPPPLLTSEELAFLALQGWLPVRLPAQLEREVQLAAREANGFFEKDEAEKKAVYPPSDGTECGYYTVPSEKEYITFRHALHRASPLEQHVQQVWRQAAAFLHRILCDIGRSQGLGVSVWDSLTRDCLRLPPDARDLENNISLMRMFKYYPQGFAEQHTDVGLLTLCVGAATGLQVVDQSSDPKVWVITNRPIVLVGEVVSALLNKRFVAGVHRVVPNPEGRGSVVFALRPCLKGDIDLTRFGGEGTMPVKSYFSKIKDKKYNINATKELREKQKRERNEQKSQTDSAALFKTGAGLAECSNRADCGVAHDDDDNT